MFIKLKADSRKLRNEIDKQLVLIFFRLNQTNSFNLS